jgi:hypothetical protein
MRSAPFWVVTHRISIFCNRRFGITYRSHLQGSSSPVSLMFCWRASSYIRIICINKMHYFLLIYFNNKPLHVSSRLTAHHQEDQLCINSNWYSHALCWLAAEKIVENSASCWFILYVVQRVFLYCLMVRGCQMTAWETKRQSDSVRRQTMHV